MIYKAYKHVFLNLRYCSVKKITVQKNAWQISELYPELIVYLSQSSIPPNLKFSGLPTFFLFS